MPPTIRQNIVTALASRLKAIRKTNGYQTDIGAHVFPWRKTQLAQTEVPAVCFYDQTGTVVSRDLRYQNIELKINLVVFSLGSASPEFCRQAAADIEEAIHANRQLGIEAVSTTFLETVSIDLAQSGDVIGAVQLEYTVTYKAPYGQI